jgi:hypothetical protein
MNCLNRLDIQRFVDNEITPSEKGEFVEHIQACAKCNELFYIAQNESRMVKKLLSSDLEFNVVTIPVFSVQKEKKKKKWLYYAAAASILIFLFTLGILDHKKSATAEINKSKADILIDQYLYESDPNKIWNEKQSCITITDEHGEVIYNNLNN